MFRLVRTDAKKFVLLSLTWDLMTSALWGACQEILNYPIMTATGNLSKSTMDLGNRRQRATRSLPPPNPLFQQQQRESTFMQEHCFLFASCSSMLYIGLYIYDTLFPISIKKKSHSIVTNLTRQCQSVKIYCILDAIWL